MPAEDRPWIRIPSIVVFLAMLGLLAFGISAIKVSEIANQTPGFSTKQTIFAAASILVFAVFAIIPYQKLGYIAYPLFGVTLFLLVLVLFLPPMKGQDVRRWINLKVIYFQPSELAKLAQIILLAWYLKSGSHYRTLRGLILPFILTLTPMFLILREPDLGTTLLFFPLLYVMLYAAGAKLKHLLSIVLVGAIVLLVPVPRSIAKSSAKVRRDRVAISYWVSKDGNTVYAPAAISAMKPHQLPRITGWLLQDSKEVINDKGFQLFHSKIVIGAGQGDWEYRDSFLDLLPEDHTDFIFSVVAGRWGLAGGLALFALYFTLFVCGIIIAGTTDDAFGRLLAIGVLALIASQFFINIGMTMGLLPITGMTLPLLSYGGSSLLINCAALGLLVNVAQRRPSMTFRRPFEHNDDKTPVPYSPVETALGKASQNESATD